MELKEVKGKASIVALTILIITLPTIFHFAYQSGLAQSTTVVFEHPIGTKSFILWLEGSTYYAKDDNDGSIDYSGSNFASIVSSVKDDLGTAGGNIFLKQATYTFTTLVNFSGSDNIIFEGEEGTIIQGTSSGNYDFIMPFYGTLNSAFITLGDVENITIKNIRFINPPNLSPAIGYFIRGWDSRNIRVEDCDFINLNVTDAYYASAVGVITCDNTTHSKGFYLYRNYAYRVGAFTHVYGWSHVWVENNWVDRNMDFGGGDVILIGDRNDHEQWDYIHVNHNHIDHGQDHAIEICQPDANGTGYHAEVIGNHIGSPDYYGNNGIGVQDVYAVVSGNTVANHTRGIVVSAGGTGQGYASITGNTLKSCGIGIQLIGQAKAVSGNTIIGNSTINTEGIYIRNVHNTAITGNTITEVYYGMTLYSNPSNVLISGNTISKFSTVTYGIVDNLDGIAKNNITVINNYFSTSSRDLVFNQTTNLVIWGNRIKRAVDITVDYQGWIDFNCGTATGTSPITVAHGLLGGSNVVTTSVNDANATITASHTSNATHIVIYHTGAGAVIVDWDAYYKP